MKELAKVRTRIKGITPLLMHSSQMVDVANEWVKAMKEITSKHHSKKTDDDYLELQRLEWNGGLYYHDDIGAYIPDIVIEGSIRDAAKTVRKGQAVLTGLSVDQTMIPLGYKGPHGREELYADKRFVDKRVVKLAGSSSLMRTRPRFDEWQLVFDITIVRSILSVADVEKFLDIAGKIKGIGDFRPKFGRFEVVDFAEA